MRVIIKFIIYAQDECTSLSIFINILPHCICTMAQQVRSSLETHVNIV
jgi:hypothetical protein